MADTTTIYADLLSDDEAILVEFVEEADTHLEDIDSLLLDMEKNPSDSNTVNTIFRSIHTLKGNSSFLGFAQIKTLSHEMESLLQDIRDDKLVVATAIVNVLLSGADKLKTIINRIRDKKNEIDDQSAFQAIIDRITDAREGRLEPVAEPSPSAAKSQSEEKTATASATAPKTVRIPEQTLDKFDTLTNELKQVHDQLQQLANATMQTLPSDTSSKIKEIHTTFGDRLSSLKDEMTTIRKVPVQNLLKKIPLIVRDICAKTGKKISLAIHGGEIMVARSIVQAMDAPMVHLIRNAVDHGAEHPHERIQQGKPEECSVQITVNEQPNSLVFTVVDDGKGIDFKKIFMKAVKNKIISINNKISRKEITNLLFHPGLSTASKVTDISGRGVGMDVVKKSVEELGGNIEIKSTPGKGSEFIITLPNNKAG